MPPLRDHMSTTVLFFLGRSFAWGDHAHMLEVGRETRGAFTTFGAPVDPRTMPAGSVILGATVDCFAKEPESDGTRWVELAYAVSMTESDVTLSKEDFEQCVVNHRRYPCVPVVIEHADTSWFGDPAQSEPHGYVEELRVGEREVTEMDGTTRTAATLEGRVSFDDATAPTVGPGKKWRFGSITIIKGAVDEATGAGLGAMLWSWSLTAHPRLMGLAPIAASIDPARLTAEQAAKLRAVLANVPDRGAAARTTTTEFQMKTFLELAARFGLAAANEEDAREKIIAFLGLGADALKALSIAFNAAPQELAAKITSLTVAAAKVPGLEQELATFRAEKTVAAKAEREKYFEDLFAVQPELKVAEASLRLHAEHDFDGFSKAHPRPSAQELIQAGQHPQRLARVTAPTAPGAAPSIAAGGSPEAAVEAAQTVANIVQTHIAIAASQGRDLSFAAALAEIGG